MRRAADSREDRAIVHFPNARFDASYLERLRYYNKHRKCLNIYYKYFMKAISPPKFIIFPFDL